MYIVAIGWAYVILMMAITASTLAKGLAILFFLGVVPLAVFIYALGERRPRSMPMPDQVPHQRNRADSESD